MTFEAENSLIDLTKLPPNIPVFVIDENGNEAYYYKSLEQYKESIEHYEKTGERIGWDWKTNNVQIKEV